MAETDLDNVLIKLDSSNDATMAKTKTAATPTIAKATTTTT